MASIKEDICKIASNLANHEHKDGKIMVVKDLDDIYSDGIFEE